jgi:DnaJ-class molecular chaperone
MSRRDLYHILGVSKHANVDEIKTAFRRAAKRLHPDAAGNDPKSQERFREAQEAYRILSDVSQRARYDESERAIKTIKIQPEVMGIPDPDPWDISVAFLRTKSHRKHSRRKNFFPIVDFAIIVAALILAFGIIVIIYYAQIAP